MKRAQHVTKLNTMGFGGDFWPLGLWNLIPQLGIKLAPPVVKAWNLNHWTASEVLILFFETVQLNTVYVVGHDIKRCFL